MAITASKDFLRFSAYSMKDLITRKLTEDGNFTDQIYEGSNLAILIDIVSYMYQCLIYSLNSAASESMFADTQLYENIVRLCKFIGYHPGSVVPATLTMSIPAAGDEHLIYPCSAIDTGLYDSQSKKIYFSTVFESILRNQAVTTNAMQHTSIRLVNGRWKHYGTVFTASGADFETFLLDGLKSDTDDKKYVSGQHIQVFVVPNGAHHGTEIDEVQMWTRDTNELFIQAYDSKTSADDAGYALFSRLYNSNDKVYTVYLNADKTFELKFGNGITGKKLNPGDEVHVMYLDTNGPDGYIDMSKITEMQDAVHIYHDPGFLGMSKAFYYRLFYDSPVAGDEKSFENISNDGAIAVTFDGNSLTVPLPEEDPSTIRQNAPDWFKTGSRLITKKDYEFFLKQNRDTSMRGVIDAVCMNNWDYLVTFYRWLYNMGISPISEAAARRAKEDESRAVEPYRYLSKSRLIQHGYEFVDSADANNIYLWIATTGDESFQIIKTSLNNSIALIKTLTSETYPLKPIDVVFDLTFTPIEIYYEKLAENAGNTAFDDEYSYLEVTITENSVYSTTSLVGQIEKILINAFDPKYCQLGQTVSYSYILNQIYAIDGIEKVRTVYYPEGYPENADYQDYKSRACDGIAFASWSSTDLIDIGDDLQINNVTRTLEKFQFPRLADHLKNGGLAKKIKIIKKSMNTTNPVKF